MEVQKIRFYGHAACPGVPGVRAMLNQAKADYEYINIHEDVTARQLVREINNGYESVPTLVFPDGSTLTEPGAGELRDKLQAMGYRVPFVAMLAGRWQYLLTGGVIIYALLRFVEII